MKFNVIIPFRGRHEYLTLCLRSLETAAAEGKDVNVTLVSDEDFSFKEDEHYDVKISFYKTEKKNKQFNKAHLLNTGLRLMRQDFDYVSIVDCDMIYNPRFFDTIESEVKDNTYFIAGGYKLTEDATDCRIDYDTPICYETNIEEKLRDENNNGLYPSQITLSKYLYNKLLDILQTKELYNEDFIGWGGEDSYLSFLSRNCENAGLLTRHYDKNMWYHLWHPSAKESEDFDNKQYEKNIQLLHKTDEENKEKILAYINS